MKDNSLSDSGTPTVDSEALGAWVAETAAKKDISEGELLDEILSSYWVLEELSDVIVDQEVDSESDTEENPIDAAVPDRQPKAREPATPETQPRTRSVEPQPKSTDDKSEISGIEQELEKLRTVINELADNEDSPEGGADEAGDEIDPAEMFDDVTDGESKPDRLIGGGAIEEIDAELVEVRSQLDSIETELGRNVAELEEDQAHLEAWIKNEFDNIENVLEHLLSTTDNIEYRLGSAMEASREQIEPLQKAHAAQQQLNTLKSEAIKKGVETAECDDCSCEVSIGMLPEPNCPECGRKFTGVEDSGWWPLSTDTLRTDPKPRPSRSSPKPPGQQQAGFGEQRGFGDKQDGFDGQQNGFSDDESGFDAQQADPSTQSNSPESEQNDQWSTTESASRDAASENQSTAEAWTKEE